MRGFTDSPDRKSWEDLVSRSSVSTWFQTPGCYDFYAGLPDIFSPFACGVTENGRLTGVIVGYVTVERTPLKQALTRRAVVNGGPLLDEGISEAALKELLTGCRKMMGSRAIYVETRNFNDYSKWRTVFETCGWKYEPHYNFHVDTSSVEVVDANMGRSRRRDARTSLRDGAVVVDKPTPGQVKEFYLVLEHLYRTRVKTPLFPISFFESLQHREDSVFLLVSYQGRIIGGTVCVCQPGRTVYEWFACGEDGVHHNVYPSTLATYAGIGYAASHGYPRFDMMGAGAPGDGGYGVRDFKSKFGGALVEHGRFKYVCSPLLYAAGALGVKLLKKI